MPNKKLLQAQLFGSFRLSYGQTAVPLPHHSAAQTLLAYLLLHRKQDHPRSLLAALLSPESDEQRARRILSQALWRSRRSLPIPLIERDNDMIRILPNASLRVDVDDFITLTAPVLQNERLTEADAQALQKAINLYRGDLLIGFYDDWVLLRREQLRETYVQTLWNAAIWEKEHGRYPAALAHLLNLSQIVPFHEAARREIMRLYAAMGRLAAARKQYTEYRHTLRQELDIEPEAATTALYRLLRDRQTEQAAPYAPPASPAPPLLDPAAPAPLVGRETERAAILTYIKAAVNGDGRTLLIAGEAGVGKTRLLQTIAHDADWHGMQTVWGQYQQEEIPLALAPLLDALDQELTALRTGQLTALLDDLWLQTLSPLLPALPAAAPLPPLEPAQEQARLINALAALLIAWSQITPLAIILEDLHWANRNALDLLAALAARLRGERLLLIGSYRDDETRADPDRWHKIQAFSQPGIGDHLPLPRLNASAAASLIRDQLGATQPTAVFADRLFRETDGNPLFIIETLRALYEEGMLAQDENGRWHTLSIQTTDTNAEFPLSPSVERVIARRLAQLTAVERTTLNIAAVLGRDFDFPLLNQALQYGGGAATPQSILPALNTLVQRHFLAETPTAYQFSHDKIRQAAYQSIPKADRARLHRQAGEAVETQSPRRAAALAYHFERGQAWEKASRYHQQAGRQAQAAYAHDNAAAHYAQALTALQRTGAAQPSRSFDIWLAYEASLAYLGRRAEQAEALAKLDTLAEILDNDQHRAAVAARRTQFAETISDYPMAVETAQKTVRLAQALGDASLNATGYMRWGTALWRLGQYDDARRRLEKAIEISQAAQLHTIEAGSLLTLSSVVTYCESSGAARPYLEQALQRFRAIGDRRGEGRTLNGLGVTANWSGDRSNALRYYKQSLQVSQEIGDRFHEGLMFNNIGLVYINLHDYAEASDALNQALQITREIADRRGESQALNSLGLLYLRQDRYSRAQSHYQQTLLITRELGDQFEECVVLHRLGDLYTFLGAREKAAVYLEKALAISREIGYRQGEGWTLSAYARCFYQCHDLRAALSYCRQALDNTQAVGNAPCEQDAQYTLGNVMAALGDLPAAAAHYRQAAALAPDNALRVDVQSGLARVALARGERTQALLYVEQIMRLLETGQPNHVHYPVAAYLTCYRVLEASHDPRAQQILHTAHRWLQDHAAQIEDDALRRSFLENVTAHRELLARFERERQEKRTLRLARRDAPVGRPLRDDEYVDVVWTAVAPEDTQIKNKVARRRHRLLRLLDEAQAQQAAPTVDDLAAALSVSPGTIKRDLAALRREGRQTPTRGSQR